MCSGQGRKAMIADSAGAAFAVGEEDLSTPSN